MAFTTAQLQALEAAMARGVLTVRYADGTQTTYRSQAEMLELRRKMRYDLGLITDRSGRKYAEHTKGFGG